MEFVALNQPPAVEAELAQWYLVRQGEILTVEAGALPVGPPPRRDTDRVASADGFTIGGLTITDPPPSGRPGVGGVSLATVPLFVGTMEGRSCWTLGVPAGTEAPDGAQWTGLRALGSSLTVPAWNAAGRAVHLIDWARTSRFCGRCGTATLPSPGERAMRCPACGLTAYPRVAPAIIVLVHRHDPAGDQVLLGRNGAFAGRMFSVLAGFVEPGETLEDTVCREVAEEVGVRLHQPRYVASQPWPFPHSLMVGFTAEWAGGEIEVDGEEIVEAGWYGRDELPAIPPRLSIARRLIEDWLAS